MLYSYATKWIGGFSLMCATQSCRATLMTSLPNSKRRNTSDKDFSRHAPSAPPAPAITAMACRSSLSRSEGKTPSLRGTGVDGLLRSGCSVHGTPHGSPHGLLACDSMCASPLKLPMQDMARTIKYWSAAISHVHWASQFKLSWSRQYMPPYLGEA